MTFCLNTKLIKPESDKEIKNIIVLLHGYGGDGNDIAQVTLNWKRFLPNTLFVCPNAPEVCKVNPTGFQWFDLMDQTDDEILSKSLIAENKLDNFINEITNQNKLSFKDIALVGFSQGCMISLQTALKKKDQIKCLIGYSGKILNIKHLNQNINSKPEIFLMHGDKDSVVPVNFLLEAKEFFSQNSYKIQTKIFNNCEHRIPTEGSSLGLEFLKKNLYK